jgi:hypothetical protein
MRSARRPTPAGKGPVVLGPEVELGEDGVLLVEPLAIAKKLGFGDAR